MAKNDKNSNKNSEKKEAVKEKSALQLLIEGKDKISEDFPDIEIELGLLKALGISKLVFKSPTLDNIEASRVPADALDGMALLILTTCKTIDFANKKLLKTYGVHDSIACVRKLFSDQIILHMFNDLFDNSRFSVGVIKN